MPIEEAIVALVIQGDAQASARADRVNVDLTAVERSAKTTEGAVNSMARASTEAVAAARRLSSEITSTVARMAFVAGQARQVSAALGNLGVSGFEQGGAASGLVDVLASGFSQGAASAAFGARFGPVGAAAGFAVGAGLGTFESVARQKKAQEDAARLAQREAERARSSDVDGEILTLVGLAKINASRGRP